MHYTPGVAADERMHARLHALHRNGVRMPAWSSLQLASASHSLCSDGDRIIVVLPEDPAKHLTKVCARSF